MDGSKGIHNQVQNGAEKYRAFRKAYPEFIYHGYQLEEMNDELRIMYHFEIPGLAQFRPTWRFPKGESRYKGDGRTERNGCLWGQNNWRTEHDLAVRNGRLAQMIFSLGMVELVSYWKLTCSPKVVVKAGKLSAEQILWWKNLYFHGLGEFFYVNHIDEAEIDNFMEISVEPEITAEWADMPESHSVSDALPADKERELMASFAEKTRVLVPIGGGKDSVVTLELLKEAKADIWGYVINPRGATVKTAEVAGIIKEKMISVSRILDKTMLELNKKGFLNGHTPFSAIVAFSSLLAAELYEILYIALSNESSANESTIQGSTVNHQYSKSFPFERDFHQYVEKYMPGSAYYFSMLRPLSEFQIAGYFSECKAYHPIFRSCNAGSKTDEWCGHCPKCVFVAAILSPFLQLEELEKIWGKNLLEEESLRGILEQLTGIQEEKPFECVGSRREVNTALFLTVRRLEKEKAPLPELLAYYKTTPQYNEAQRLGDVYSDYFDEENLVPEPWKALVRSRCFGEAAKRRIC